MIGYWCPFSLPMIQYQLLNCRYSEEAVKRPRRKSIIGQFLWSNGLGDWSANLKLGPSSVRIREQWSGRALKKMPGKPLFFRGGSSRVGNALGLIPAKCCSIVGLLPSVRVLYARNWYPSPTSVWHTKLLNGAKKFTRQSPAVPRRPP